MDELLCLWLVVASWETDSTYVIRILNVIVGFIQLLLWFSAILIRNEGIARIINNIKFLLTKIYAIVSLKRTETRDLLLLIILLLLFLGLVLCLYKLLLLHTWTGRCSKWLLLLLLCRVRIKPRGEYIFEGVLLR